MVYSESESARARLLRSSGGDQGDRSRKASKTWPGARRRSPFEAAPCRVLDHSRSESSRRRGLSICSFFTTNSLPLSRGWLLSLLLFVRFRRAKQRFSSWDTASLWLAAIDAPRDPRGRGGHVRWTPWAPSEITGITGFGIAMCPSASLRSVCPPWPALPCSALRRLRPLRRLRLRCPATLSFPSFRTEVNEDSASVTGEASRILLV
mmetsp:Transcript_42261/g.91730  ORF Transcript_42261/g.91730 Transcript_42261/m.91730 type:complete len:207 (-) Transcript_42261:477-1097(-)